MAKPWREMDGEERIKGIVGLIVLVFGIVVFFIWVGASEDAARDQRARATELQAAVAAHDPVRFAKALIPGAEATFESDRNPQTGLIDRFSTLTVQYSIDPVPSSNVVARDQFFRHVVEIVPAILGNFDTIEVIEVKGTAEMVDIRGHESIEEVAGVILVRSNVLDVNWPKVKPENVPLLANRHFLHPRLVSDLAPSDTIRATSSKVAPREGRSSSR